MMDQKMNELQQCEGVCDRPKTYDACIAWRCIILNSQLLLELELSLTHPSSSSIVLPSIPLTHPLTVMSLFNPTICLATLNTFPLPSSASNMSQYLCLSSPWALATTLLDLQRYCDM